MSFVAQAAHSGCWKVDNTADSDEVSESSWSLSASSDPTKPHVQKSKKREEKDQRTFQLGETLVDLITFLDNSLAMFPEPCDELLWLSSLREKILAGPNELLEVSKVLWRHMWIGSSFVQSPDRLALARDLRLLKRTAVDRLELFADRFLLGVELGAGGFGKVNRAEDMATDRIVAIKRECKRRSDTLKREVDAYSRLKGGEGIPNLCDYSINGNCNYLAMDLLGDSLHVLFENHGKNFTSKTILMIAMKMIRRVEFVHSKGLILGDIKPDNFAIGVGQAANEVFLLDFGVSQQYPASPDVEIHRFQGTPLFASINAHRGSSGPSPRDDLESIGYTLLYFFRGGSLPWTSGHRQCGSGWIHHMLLNSKMGFVGKYGDVMNCPSSLATYMDACHGLASQQTPDYNKLLSVFLDNLEKDGSTCDFDNFDCMPGRLDSEKAKRCFQDADCSQSKETLEHGKQQEKPHRPMYDRLRLPPVPSELPRLGLRMDNGKPCHCAKPGETKTATKATISKTAKKLLTPANKLLKLLS